MSRIIALLYGIASYAFAFVTLLYAICFVSGFIVPKTIDSGAAGPVTEAIFVNLILMTIFAVQHSVMARPQFKEWWTRIVPKSVERSTYVLFASLALALLYWQWRPMPAVIWQVDNPEIAKAITAVSLIGWFIVFTSTFLINHFELFGVHQVVNNLSGRPMPSPRFRTPLYYKFVRTPDLSRTYYRVLGSAGDDGGTPVICGGHDRLHPRWHPARGARPDDCVRR